MHNFMLERCGNVTTSDISVVGEAQLLAGPFVDTETAV